MQVLMQIAGWLLFGTVASLLVIALAGACVMAWFGDQRHDRYWGDDE